MNRNKWDITAEAQELRLAFTPVLSAGELFEDQQLKARKFFDTTRHPRLGQNYQPRLAGQTAQNAVASRKGSTVGRTQP